VHIHVKVLRIAYSAEHGFPTHRDCVNFSDGVCMLTGVEVDPNKPACPNFIPKIMTARPRAARGYPEAQQTYQTYASQSIRTYPPHGHQSRYGFGRISSAVNTVMQGCAGSVVASPRAGGRGGMGDFVARGGGRGRGRMGGVSAGPGGSCVCPNCGYSTSHIVGTPCYQQTCPRCGSKMTRGS
jgi:hypothetical protein